MTIVKWQVGAHALNPVRREYEKETACFYFFRSEVHGEPRRDAKSSPYYWYFDSEPEAMEFMRLRSARLAERKRVDQINRCGVELLEALENLENDNGQIPDHAWALVKSAIAKAKGLA